MIIDTLTAAVDNPLYPAAIRRILAAIVELNPDTLPAGKYQVDGNQLFFTVAEGETRPLAEQRPEYHRQYLDIHIVLAGEEVIGAGVKGLPLEADGEFYVPHDLGFCLNIASESLIHLRPGELAILFPEELHRPMSTLGAPAPLRKIVAKIDSALL